jgi:hypothetical protein rflaF_00555
MARSKIIKDIIQSNKSISTSLQELLVIVNELGNKELNRWIKNELNGYEAKEELPEYRKNLPNVILYSGLNRKFQITNQPLPIQSFGEYAKDISNLNYINNSILEIENSKDGNMHLDLTRYAGVIHKNTGIYCVSISMKFGNNLSDIIISNVKTKIIESLLLLESEFGILDELCIGDDKPAHNKIDKINKEINSIIFSDGARY